MRLASSNLLRKGKIFACQLAALNFLVKKESKYTRIQKQHQKNSGCSGSDAIVLHII